VRDLGAHRDALLCNRRQVLADVRRQVVSFCAAWRRVKVMGDIPQKRLGLFGRGEPFAQRIGQLELRKKVGWLLRNDVAQHPHRSIQRPRVVVEPFA